MKNYYKNQSGMTLVEVMIAGSLVAGLAVAGMTMFKTQTTAQKTVEQNYEVMTVVSQIRTFLSNPDNCRESLPVNANGGTVNNLRLFPWTTSAQDRFVRNSILPGNVIIRSYTTDTTVPGLSPGQTALKIVFSRGNNTIKDSIQKNIVISYTGGTPIATCYAAQNQLDSFWIKSIPDPSEIYYMAGNVGIGTADPRAKLEVQAGTEGQAGPVEAIRIWGPNAPATANSAQDINYAFNAAGSARIRAYRGASWDTYLQFLTNPSNPLTDNPQVRMHISHDGKVGIGETAPIGKLHLYSNMTDPAVTYSNLVSFSTFSPSVANSVDLWGINASTAYSSTSNGGRIIGAHIAANVNSSGNANMIGLVSAADNYAGATVADSMGLYSRAANYGSGSIGNAKGIYTAVTNSGSGSIAAATGVYIDAIQATNKWGLYQADVTANNYFGGNVGIGYTVPSARLHIRNQIDPGTTAAAIHIDSPGTSGGTAVPQYGIRIVGAGYNNSTNLYGVHSTTPQATTQPTYALYGDASGIYGNAHGLFATARQANIGGPATAFGVYGEATSAGAGSLGKTYAGYFNNTASLGGDAVGVYASSINGNPLVVNAGATSRMIVNQLGNVGIGTNNPQVKLHVAGTRIRIESTAARSWDITADNSPDGFQVRNITAGTFPFHISGVNGNVGIGTTSPGYTLHVAGTAAATSFVYISDKRLKKSINTIDNPLEKILALRGVNFSWKDNDKKDIGFIAQEIEKIEPRLVETAKDGFKSVKYGNIVAIVIEAMKELNQKILKLIVGHDELKRENEMLKKRLDLQEAKTQELMRQQEIMMKELMAKEKK